MFKNNRLFLHTIFCIVFSLFSVFANAQSKSVKAALENADDLFAYKKHHEALAIYLQHTAFLTDLQQYQVGVCYFASGKENATNYTEAVSWFIKASDRGNTVAMHSISYCYGNGYGVPKDTVQQVNWMKKLAGLGDASGMVDMGYRYEHGSGVPLDKKLGEELYKKAFDKGSKEAGYYLGLIRYNENNGVQAIYYLTKAADGGMLPAMLKLGQVYEEGPGMEKDPDAAVRWYTKIKKTPGYTNAHAKAIGRIRAIGEVEPSTNLNTVKPALLKIIAGAGNQFSGLLGHEIEPLHSPGVAILSKYTHYTCLADPGFKNATIKKEVVEDKTFGDVRTRAGVYYSYSADIVHSVQYEATSSIFDQWVKVLKAVVPGWENSTINEKGRFFKISGKLSNGKTVNIYLSSTASYVHDQGVFIKIETGM